ncbi:Cupredoxin [Stachybotrys elegans]|uniref:Cupredoxin n=1 Tax=Stachybotrys elegans TaxID=80388 RepID=A0A8K0SHG4_9HYPO|nr:Cupredoxin [Stachybotrys elegans]
MLLRSGFGFAALALTALQVAAQANAPVSRTEIEDLPYHIPESEAAALEEIIEDDSDVALLQKRKDWLSPEYKFIYQKPLPIPPALQPATNSLMNRKVKNPINGKDIWYYELEIKSFTQQVYPNLGPAQLVGYDGISPGPSIVVPRGTESIVRFINNAAKPNSVHLHGSPSRAPFDGWAEDTTLPGQFKDYYYPNDQSARFLWYHDHAVAITAENAYFGQAGAYLITDAAEDVLNLPKGYGVYDIPLVLASKQYNNDGSLFSTAGETDSLWGDVIHVNGQPWPFFNVEPRKYRLRFLNAAVSRSFALYFAQSTSTGTKLPFKVIASDAGLLSRPVQTSVLYASMAERWEVVFDFSQFKGKSIDLRNLEDVGDFGADDDYLNTNKVMRFVVSSKSPAQPDTSVVPSALRQVPFPAHGNAINHHFRFHRSNGQWLINDIGFADAQNRVLANVPRGTVEIWELENSSGGWTHPIHVHLVDLKVLSRTGKRGVMPYEAEGLKDVVWLAKGETVRVEAHYQPWAGLYMFHCHNLIHEDHDMMAAFNVTILDGYGYNETTFLDPMDPTWRPKPYNVNELRSRSGYFSDQKIIERINFMASFDPYGDDSAP